MQNIVYGPVGPPSIYHNQEFRGNSRRDSAPALRLAQPNDQSDFSLKQRRWWSEAVDNGSGTTRVHPNNTGLTISKRSSLSSAPSTHVIKSVVERTDLFTDIASSISGPAVSARGTQSITPPSNRVSEQLQGSVQVREVDSDDIVSTAVPRYSDTTGIELCHPSPVRISPVTRMHSADHIERRLKQEPQCWAIDKSVSPKSCGAMAYAPGKSTASSKRRRRRPISDIVGAVSSHLRTVPVIESRVSTQDVAQNRVVELHLPLFHHHSDPGIVKEIQNDRNSGQDTIIQNSSSTSSERTVDQTLTINSSLALRRHHAVPASLRSTTRKHPSTAKRHSISSIADLSDLAMSSPTHIKEPQPNGMATQSIPSAADPKATNESVQIAKPRLLSHDDSNAPPSPTSDESAATTPTYATTIPASSLLNLRRRSKVLDVEAQHFPSSEEGGDGSDYVGDGVGGKRMSSVFVDDEEMQSPKEVKPLWHRLSTLGQSLYGSS